MTTFERTLSQGEHPEHQKGHVERGWEITDETEDGWHALKEVAHPERLKEGENPEMECLFLKSQWKIVE